MRVTAVWQPPPGLVARCAMPKCGRTCKVDGIAVYWHIARGWCLGGGGDDWCPKHNRNCKHWRARRRMDTIRKQRGR